MRGNISESSREYIKELEDEIRNDPFFADEIVTIDDQIMTAQQAVNLMKESSLTSRTYNARKSR